MATRVGIYYAYWEQNWPADLLSYPQRVAKLGFECPVVSREVCPRGGMVAFPEKHGTERGAPIAEKPAKRS